MDQVKTHPLISIILAVIALGILYIALPLPYHLTDGWHFHQPLYVQIIETLTQTPQTQNINTLATSYEECTNLEKSVIQESYPATCIDPQGNRFIQPTPIPTPNTSMTNSTQSTIADDNTPVFDPTQLFPDLNWEITQEPTQIYNGNTYEDISIPATRYSVTIPDSDPNKFNYKKEFNQAYSNLSNFDLTWDYPYQGIRLMGQSADGPQGSLNGWLNIQNNQLQEITYGYSTTSVDFSPDQGSICPCTVNLDVWISDFIPLDSLIH